jgi:hypothetical protein
VHNILIYYLTFWRIYMTLNFFPMCRPDEDLRSIIFKYSKQSLDRLWVVSKTLFGVASKPNRIMYANIGQMLETIKVPGTIHFNHFINQHTFWPIFRVFMQKEKMEQAYNYLYKSEISINSPFNPSLLSMISDDIRYCQICMMEDYSRGEVYIHRMHQFRHFDVCYIHKIKLLSVCYECSMPLAELSRYQLIKPECPNCQAKIDFLADEPQAHPLVIELLSNLFILLNHEHELNANIFVQKILIRLGNLGYIHFKGAIYKTNMIQDFLGSYSIEEFDQIGLNSSYINDHKFVTKMFDQKFVQTSVMFYLLLQKWLFNSAEKLIQTTETYSYPLPFGPGPWLCFNKICPEHKQKVVVICTRHVHEYVTGVFCCPVCGMIYSRRSKPGQVENEYNFSVEFFGDLWMDRLNELSQTGMTQDEIASILQTSNISVRKYLRILSNTRENKNYRFSKYTDEVIESRLQDSRELLKQTIDKLGKEARRPAIRNMMGKNLYDWLMKNDRDWMERMLPSRQPNLYLSRDYESIDRDLCMKIKKVKEDLVASDIPRKITPNMMLRQLSKLDYGRFNTALKKTKLAKAQALLELLAESQTEFQKRMFPIAVKRFKKSNFTRITLGLLKNFHSTYKNCSEEVEMWLSEQLMLVSQKMLDK